MSYEDENSRNIFDNDKEEFTGWNASSELENRWVCTFLYFKYLIYTNLFFII